MWFMSGVRIWSAGPDVRTSLCGMTSLFFTVRGAPRQIWIDWAALYGPALNDQVWQPRSWWRIVRVAAVPWAEADDTTSAPAQTARAATRRRMRFFRFMINSFVVSRPSLGRCRSAGISGDA